MKYFLVLTLIIMYQHFACFEYISVYVILSIHIECNKSFLGSHACKFGDLSNILEMFSVIRCLPNLSFRDGNRPSKCGILF